ncbi:MAG: glycosyltransferase [Thermoplasmata archaeon]
MMNILLVTPVFPPRIGGIEELVATLGSTLVDQGHTVTVFTSGHRQRVTKPELVEGMRVFRYKTLISPLGNPVVPSMILESLETKKFDVVHAHSYLHVSSCLAALASARKGTPTILTSHGALHFPGLVGAVEKAYESLVVRPVLRRLQAIITISDFQKRIVHDIGVDSQRIRVIPNGLRFEKFPFKSKKNGPLLFLGRIVWFKGVLEAIELAKKCRLPLNVVGEDRDVPDRGYVAKVRERCKGRIKYMGPVPESKKLELLSEARALIFLPLWDEPFGLTAVEAGACGTPVVALSRGALPEIIRNGVNGFLCSTTNEMSDVLSRLGDLDPAGCREFVLAKFNADIMTARYCEVYKELVANN